MTECLVCLESVDSKRCEECLQGTCYKCTIMNDGRCCYCGYVFDDVEREIQMQISALRAIKRNHDSLSFITKTDSLIKPCPICKTLIERDNDDCKQMFCTVCKTVWQWDTLEIVTNVLEIHNPVFFQQTDFTTDTTNRGVVKCLKALSGENAKYMSDTFVYRLLFLSEQVTFEEFTNMIRERFDTFVKHIKLKRILETDCDNDKIKLLNRNWNVTSDSIILPYV